MFGTLTGRANQLLTNPGAGLEPIRTAMRTGVNQSFGNVPGVLADKLLSYGGGRSGKFGTALRTAEIARLGGLADVENNIAQMILEQQDRGTSLAERLLSLPFEQETSGETSYESTGTNTMPGNMLGGGIAGGLDTLSTMLMLNRMLQGGR